jgi:hypothetical protein
MHKSKSYGKILLEQKYEQDAQQKYQQTIEQSGEQNSSTCSTFVGTFVDVFVQGFVQKLLRFLPFSEAEIEAGLLQLIENKVIYLDGPMIYQKRMIKDAEISAKRASAGKNSAKKRGYGESFKAKKKPDFVHDFVRTNNTTKVEQNSIYDYLTDKEDKKIDRLEGNNMVLENTRGVQGGEKKIGASENENSELPAPSHPTEKIEMRISKKLADVDVILEKYFTSPAFSRQREALCMANGMEPEKLVRWGKAFNIYLISRAVGANELGEVLKQDTDWANHFASWLQKQDLSLNPDELENERRKKFLEIQEKHPSKISAKRAENFDERIARETDPDKRRNLETLKFSLFKPNNG